VLLNLFSTCSPETQTVMSSSTSSTDVMLRLTHQVVILLLDLSMFLKKVQVQLQSEQKRDKEKIQIGIKNELHDSSNSEFEKLLNVSFSKVKKKERYAPLNNTKENYIII